MMKPTQEQIAEEIAKLKAMKPTVIRSSVFGDNHWDAIDAQINVLENQWGDNRVYDKYPCQDEDDDGYPDNVRDAAYEAASWLNGETEEGESPSDNWQSLVRK
jgi:hypothetical protein